MPQQKNNAGVPRGATPVNAKGYDPYEDDDYEDDDAVQQQQAAYQQAVQQARQQQAQQQKAVQQQQKPAQLNQQAVQQARQQQKAVQQFKQPNYYQPTARPGIGTGYHPAVQVVLQIFAGLVGIAITVVSGIFDTIALSLFGPDFAYITAFLTFLIGITELYFWFSFHDKSLWDLIKMIFTGGLGFGGYGALCAVVLSILFNFFALVSAAGHRTVDVVTNERVKGKIIEVTSHVSKFNQDWNSAVWPGVVFGFLAFVMSAAIGVFFSYSFTGRLFGSGRAAR